MDRYDIEQIAAAAIKFVDDGIPGLPGTQATADLIDTVNTIRRKAELSIIRSQPRRSTPQ